MVYHTRMHVSRAMDCLGLSGHRLAFLAPSANELYLRMRWSSPMPRRVGFMILIMAVAHACTETMADLLRKYESLLTRQSYSMSRPQLRTRAAG